MADASLSSYPTAVDNFDRISDLDKDSTMIKAVQYKSYINSGNYTAAENYLKNNPDLKQCAISAEIVNKHSDAIVAIENDIKDNVKSNINTLTQNQNNIKKNISDVENKLGYEINDITGGVRLAINDEILNIYGHNRSKVSLKRGSSSDPDSISINTPYFICTNLNNDYPEGETISYDKILHFKGSQYYHLYEACFYHQGSSFIEINEGKGVRLFVSNTNWRDPYGSSKMPLEYYLFSVEGGIRTAHNVWYPFGYNMGSTSVNAYFGNPAGEGDGMKLVVECTGINISDIECTCGIIKYYLEKRNK